MSNGHLSIKFKKILILGVAIAGIFFLNKRLIYNQSGSESGFAVQPLSKGFSLVEFGVRYELYRDKLRSYPDPGQFKNFGYKNESLEFSGECSDKYYTILIYEKDVDYRVNPNSAKLNQAFECPSNKKFKFIINEDTRLAEEKYYIIFADQGEEGSWYNPR